MKFKVIPISLFFLIFISTITNAYAQVYTEQVDMLCPDFMLGSWFDFGETRDWIHICPINEPKKPTGTPVDNDPTCVDDSDGDKIDDCSDLCPLEPETFNFFEDTDGCPDETDEPIQTIFGLILFQAFGNTITTAPNSFITNQPILIQWNNPDDMIITGVTNTQSPFDFTYEDFPVIKTGSGLPLSQNNVYYNVQIPSEICGAVVTNECVQLVRYEIPTKVSGIINGTIVQDDTYIIIDLSDDDFNPVLLLLWLLLLIPIIGIIYRKKKKKHQNQNKVRTFLN